MRLAWNHCRNSVSCRGKLDFSPCWGSVNGSGRMVNQAAPPAATNATNIPAANNQRPKTLLARGRPRIASAN